MNVAPKLRPRVRPVVPRRGRHQLYLLGGIKEHDRGQRRRGARPQALPDVWTAPVLELRSPKPAATRPAVTCRSARHVLLCMLVIHPSIFVGPQH